MRFLNTTETTSMGCGVGLEVGNSIYFDMPADQFAYWNTDGAGREMVRMLIQSGHIDCLHSYGDRAITRGHAGRALDDLTRHDCQIRVWVDHAVAPTNFGADIMRGFGDLPGSAVYHADLTCGYGIEYVWRGRVTSVTGQDVPPLLGGVFTPEHPISSARTLAKEKAKRLLACCGSRRYAMHGPNRLLRATRLRDGRPVHEFLRCNPHWGGVGCGATAAGLAEALTGSFLQRLVEREGLCVLYTHLGKASHREEALGPSTKDALRLLADYKDRGEIMVTTTRRLLAYSRALGTISVTPHADAGSIWIDITTPSTIASGNGALSTSDLAGLTWYTTDPRDTHVRINGVETSEIRRNGPDHTGRSSISLPWRPLEFPDM